MPNPNPSTTSCNSSPNLKPINEEKLSSSLADMNSIYMPFMLPINAGSENALLTSLNLNTSTAVPFGALSIGLGSLTGFQVTPPSPLFACSQAFTSAMPIAPTPFDHPSLSDGGLASIPIEPTVGQIPEEMTAFNSFLTSVRRLEALFHQHNSALITTLNL
ncbi:unnamed protein product [Toxocara canis]|uniref:Uncharacterized protein n=1 Tax=Toxocara canis TaxID=6265 RepID=A0A3P7IJY5_TOXCA|nr:unnamed protein product [Toxocara canis]